MQPCIRSVNINILMDNCGVLGIPWIPVTGMSRKIRIQNSYAVSNPAKRKPLWLNSNGHPKNIDKPRFSSCRILPVEFFPS